jgi:F0F1-type ATP synthase membrane subunit b/b'
MIEFSPESFVIQIVSFFVLWFGLKRLLFDPFLEVLERRQARTAGVRQEAAALHAEVDRSATAFDERLIQVRDEIGGTADTARNATDEEERRILATARERAAAHLREQRDQLQAEAQAARSALAGESNQLASLIVKKVVGERA